jgi:hypothetical protein
MPVHVFATLPGSPEARVQIMAARYLINEGGDAFDAVELKSLANELESLDEKPIRLLAFRTSCSASSLSCSKRNRFESKIGQFRHLPLKSKVDQKRRRQS